MGRKKLTAGQRLHGLWLELQGEGWRRPDDHPARFTEVEIIEEGSCGVHRGFLGTTCWWVVDADDTYPSKPFLWRPLSHEEGT